jgi:hypothetical protein
MIAILQRTPQRLARPKPKATTEAKNGAVRFLENAHIPFRDEIKSHFILSEE